MAFEPNPETTAFTWFQAMQAHAISHGNAYSYIFRNGDASPREFRLLVPDKTWPVRVNGQLRYVTSVDSSHQGATEELRILRPEDVIHIKGLGFDGLVGYTVIELAAETIGLGLALAK